MLISTKCFADDTEKLEMRGAFIICFWYNERNDHIIKNENKQNKIADTDDW